MAHQSPAAARISNDPGLSLRYLLDPGVLENPYPLYDSLRTQDPVHWDPYLHAWVVTRYADAVAVLQRFLAARTPTPEQLTSIGLSELNPVAQVLVKMMLFMDPPAHSRIRALAAAAFSPRASKPYERTFATLWTASWSQFSPRGVWMRSRISAFPFRRR